MCVYIYVYIFICPDVAHMYVCFTLVPYLGLDNLSGGLTLEKSYSFNLHIPNLPVALCLGVGPSEFIYIHTEVLTSIITVLILQLLKFHGFSFSTKKKRHCLTSGILGFWTLPSFKPLFNGIP